MNKKSILGLILFGALTLAGLFVGALFMIDQESHKGPMQIPMDQQIQDYTDVTENMDQAVKESPDHNAIDLAESEPWLLANPSEAGPDAASADKSDDTKVIIEEASGDDNNGLEVTESGVDSLEGTHSSAGDGLKNPGAVETSATQATEGNGTVQDDNSTLETGAVLNPLQLIGDHEKVDYRSYIPQMVMDGQLEIALDIANPSIDITAKSAILFDAKTGAVLYHKAAVEPVFPASTAKLLNALVALDWCEQNEEVTLGSEIDMTTTDSSTAYLKVGQVLSVRNLLEGMLVPSGNDAAYAMAAYVGRKSLKDLTASCESAVLEFVRLMNQKAKELGVKNSCFMTPDGYDAIGQYTTAYDMGLIGLAAVKNDIILEITKKVKARNVFISGEDVTWENTNALINKNSGGYYSCAVGLKTGTSTMAGKCLVAAGRKDGKEVLCVIMNSTGYGRWEDAVALLKYGLNK